MYSSGLLFILFIAFASASSGYHRPSAPLKINSTVKTSSSDHVTAKSARSEYYPHHGFDHHYGGGHHFGSHHLGHHKEFEQYLLPMLLVLGLGVLCMPLLGVMMSTMVGNVPVTTLVSGRKKREAVVKPVADQTILKLWQKVSKAIEVFTEVDK